MSENKWNHYFINNTVGSTVKFMFQEDKKYPNVFISDADDECHFVCFNGTGQNMDGAYSPTEKMPQDLLDLAIVTEISNKNEGINTIYAVAGKKIIDKYC